MERHYRITAASIACALSLATAPTQAIERLRLISHVDGQPGLRLGGHDPAISADGRYVAFHSTARLTSDDGNDHADVYDVETCGLERVSKGGESGGAQDFRPAISGAGRYVAFTSDVALVASDTDSTDDVYLYDRQTLKTTRISAPRVSLNLPANPSKNPSISADGRYVAFESDRPNLVSGDGNGTTDIFRYGIEDGTIDLVSVAYDGEQRMQGSVYPQINADGQWVIFSSSAHFINNGAAGIPPGIHLYGRNMLAKSVDIRLLDRNKFGEIANPGISSLHLVAISGDGERVAFSTSAANMRDGFAVGNANSINTYLYLRDLDGADPAMRLEMADHDAGISIRNDMPTLSYDAEWMVFAHGNSSLYPRKPYRGLYRAHSASAQPERITPAIGGGEENGTSEDPSLSAEGLRVAFESNSSNLLANAGGSSQIYLRDLSPVGFGLPVCPSGEQRAR